MKRPDTIPEAVTRGVQRWAEQHKRVHETERTHTETTTVPELQWDSINGCYYFIRNGIFHGVELDGHIHT